jgi:hypothetical protein
MLGKINRRLQITQGEKHGICYQQEMLFISFTDCKKKESNSRKKGLKQSSKGKKGNAFMCFVL